jgi:hypothetical protein
MSNQPKTPEERLGIDRMAAIRAAANEVGTEAEQSAVITTDDEKIFTPNDKAREAFKRMSDAGSDAMMAQFFEIWEAEGEPRRAGSMAAHAYIRNAARMAVFGAQCAGHPPQIDLWLECCEQAFHDAVTDVGTAFLEVAIDETTASGGLG